MTIPRAKEEFQKLKDIVWVDFNELPCGECLCLAICRNKTYAQAIKCPLLLQELLLQEMKRYDQEEK